MTDIERRLRDLGERVRAEQRTTALQPETIRAAKRRRLGTALSGLVTVTALVFAASLAAANLGDQSDRVGPADDPTGTTTNILYSHLGPDERAEIFFDVDGGQVCYALDSLDEYGTFTRVEIVKGLEEKSAVVHSPPPYRGRSPEPGSRECVAGVDGAVLNEILVSPDDYFLLLEDPLNGERVSSLVSGKKVDAPACGPPVDFEPTYLPQGWIKELQPGSGGGAAWDVVGHYGMAGEARTEKASAGFAELFAGESPYPLGGGEKIRVLDEPARFGAIHEGFAVEFSQRGCEYALIGYMDGKELKRFAQGLRLPGERVPAKPSDGEDFAAIWPEDTYEHAEEACASAAHEADSWRADPERTALKFGAVVLGWDDPVLAESEEKYNQDYAYELRPAPSSRAGVIVFPVLIDQGWCWAIGSVSQLPEHQPEHHGSMSVQDRDVYMRFDTGGATSAVFEVGYGGQTSRHIWYAGDDEAVEFRLDFEPRGTGHFLVLLRDENDVVFSAFGSPLPEGSFAAG